MENDFTNLFKELNKLELETMTNETALDHIQAIRQQLHVMRTKLFNGFTNEDINEMADYFNTKEH